MKSDYFNTFHPCLNGTLIWKFIYDKYWSSSQQGWTQTCGCGSFHSTLAPTHLIKENWPSIKKNFRSILCSETESQNINFPSVFILISLILRIKTVYAAVSSKLLKIESQRPLISHFLVLTWSLWFWCLLSGWSLTSSPPPGHCSSTWRTW